jgi:hypothetical protein
VKRAAISTRQNFFQGGNHVAGSNSSYLEFSSSNTLRVAEYNGSAETYALETTQVFRDPSAWLHLAVAIDTTQATASNRIKVYVNGSQVTTFSTSSYPSQNLDTSVSNTVAHSIGYDIAGNQSYLSAYLADIHFIDGQALDPTSFGEFSATTGVWVPKAFAGSYGTNGFRLNFADNSAATATTLGKDAAGSNNWTPNNLSVTAGAGNDSLVDVPTNGAQTDTGAGGEVRGNYCTTNPLDNGGLTLSNGNLDVTHSSSTWYTVRGTIGISSGKWYWEILVNNLPASSGTPFLSRGAIGIAQSNAGLGFLGGNANGWMYYSPDGTKVTNNSYVAYGAAYNTANDVVGVAFDADNGTLTFYKNNASQGQAFSGLTSGPYFPAVALLLEGGSGNPSISCNWGARPFAYTAPSGFKALNTANLPAPVVTKPSDLMDVKLYTGNGSTQTISGLGFSPDFVWIKQRSGAVGHALMDAVRGSDKRLFSEGTFAEDSVASLTSFNSDGFTVSIAGGLSTRTNESSQTYVAWAWDAGTTTTTNTVGSISSQVRANASAGFSVVTYTAGASNSTVGHGLGAAPHMIIAKSRTVAGARWDVYHRTQGKDKYLYLDGTDAVGTAANYWGSVEPTSTTFGVATAGFFNNTGDMVAYCFAPVAGYSSFGSYTGNGSADGPFVYTGMRPRLVWVKRTDSTGWWYPFDTARNTSNVTNSIIELNGALAETTGSNYAIDITSNGFKLRATHVDVNASGGTYIWAAFAESPFQYARAR